MYIHPAGYRKISGIYLPCHIVDNIYLKTLLEYMFKDAQISVEYSRENATIEISVK